MMTTVRVRKRKPSLKPLLGEQPGTTYQNKANLTILAIPLGMVATRS